MDQDQLSILYIYSLYSEEKKHRYLQYTAALVLFYYLMKKGLFPAYKDELLVYDYKNTRRFLWEDKKFMNDINIVRAQDFLIRSRVKTSDYRDINAHQCTHKGDDFIRNHEFSRSDQAQKIKSILTSKCGNTFQVQLDDDTPRLVCKKCKESIQVQGFLCDLHTPIDENFSPAFL